MTETLDLLQEYQGTKAAKSFLKQIEQSNVDIFQIEALHLTRLQVLVDKYADLPMDLADASLVILAEELGHGRILSTDQCDFRTIAGRTISHLKTC